ncbi:MAG TPA: FMN-binding protein [Candidatus Saccharimonadales bacterium]|nr:FMN-binding protein [Candidatus Saccharimonadales bacterium]
MKLLLSIILLLSAQFLNAAEKSREEVQAIIKNVGSTPPDWFKETPLRYPSTLDLSWPPDPKGPWDPSKNVGQFIWTSINENEGRWKEGIRFLHHLLIVNQKKPDIVKKTMNALAHMYHNLHQDWARAAFWWQKAGETDKIELAHCYFKLGSKAMAVEILNEWPADHSRHCGVARLWSEIGENEKALKLALKRAKDTPDVGYLAAGDICRTAGRSKEALAYYKKALDASKGGVDLKQTRDRAQASIEAIRLVDTLNIKQVPDGAYRDSSIGYNGPVQVEVRVASGKISGVQVVRHQEKQFYSSITDTCQQMILKQGAKGVDATSGATITSEAILNAGLKALAKAQR